MSKKKKPVPRLRFPEFKIGWKKKKFDFDMIPTNSFSRAEMNDYSGKVRNIHYGDILTKYDEILSEAALIPFLNEEIDLSKFHKDSYLQTGDIIIADTAEDFMAGKAIEVRNIDFPVLAGQHTLLCRPSKKYAAKFLGYYFNSPLYHNRLIPLLTGTKVYSISKTNIKSTYIIYPGEFKEQQKIADCLASVDVLIKAETKKLELLKKYKRGLMQKLFPAQGKTVPEWRFPEFRDCGEWEETVLEKVSYYENGKAHENSIEENGTYIVVNSKFISTDGAIKKYSNAADMLAARGDILMVLSDVPNGKALAKCYFVRLNNTYTVNQRVCRLTPHNVNGVLLFYILNRNAYFLRFDDGVKQTNLKKADVLSCLILIPKTKEEQQKIADVLSETDAVITAQSNKIKNLRRHKKGLMQGLFPSSAEVDE